MYCNMEAKFWIQITSYVFVVLYKFHIPKQHRKKNRSENFKVDHLKNPNPIKFFHFDPRKSYDTTCNIVNTQKWLTTSSTPLHGSFVHLPTIFP